MSAAPADVLRQLLIDLGLGVEAGNTWPIFVGFLNDEDQNIPANALCVYDTSGKLDGRIMQTGEQVEHPGIQIRIRSLEYPVGFEKAKNITLALDAVRHVLVTVGADLYLIQNVSRAGAIIPLGVESTEQRRFHFTVNAMLTLTERT